MRILLQDTRTHNYIGTKPRWTTNHSEARTFPHGMDALFFCYDARIPNMVMLFEFTDGRMNFSFPVTDSRID